MRQVNDGEANTEKVNKKKLGALIAFVQQTILRDNQRRRSKIVGGWEPIYGNRPEVHLPQLYNLFKELLTKIPHRADGGKPRFLDCGSGFGEVGAVAALAGFESFNIEVQREIHDLAAQYATMLTQAGTIKEGSTHQIHGSYYTPDFFQMAEEAFLHAHNVTADHIPSRSINIAGYSLGLMGDINYHTITNRLEQMRAETTSMERSGLLVNQVGKPELDVDVVYCYASDPLFEFGFMPQMTALMRPSSLLVLPTHNSQVRMAHRRGQIRQFSDLVTHANRESPVLVLRR